MKYENQCGSCVEFKDQRDCRTCFDVSCYEKGYCDYHRCYYYPDDSCSHYKNRSNYVPSTCYITTIICNILGYSDDCEILNTLREFRNNVLQKDEQYKDILFQYDVVGPIIAQNLGEDFKDKSDDEIIIGIYNFYLQPTARFIKENNYGDAISRYMEMTTALADYYGINMDVKALDDYDNSIGGHGAVKMKKLGVHPLMEKHS